MRIVLWFLFMGFILDACSCNHEKKDEGSRFLEHDYDFVLGFAVPDEDRLVLTEVFVGRILDHPVDELYLRGMQDSFLWEQVQRYYSWYQGEIIYHEDAEVTISSETQSVKLQHVGYGTYRDVNNALHIEALKEYMLEVKRPGNRLYTASVIVPGDFEILNVHEGDTVGPVLPKRLFSQPICYSGVQLIWGVSSLAQLYRSKTFYDSGARALDDFFVPYVKGASFRNDDLGVNAFYDEENNNDTIRYFDHEILALDTSASIFYQSEGLGLGPAVDSFLSYWNSGNIEKRSGLNTHGAKDVIGNFGAYNAARIHFWVWAKKDSCGIIGP
ncbi:hypothetical protein JNL27_15360 [bacterium]|nr:hypothetical protein [bacterium]